MDKTLRAVIIICLCVITFSVFYYLVIFLPKNREAVRKAEQAEKVRKELKESQSKLDYDACRRGVEIAYGSNRESTCKRLRKGPDCSLPRSMYERWDRFRKEGNEQCYKVYLQSR
ncbi:MAG: hypothetical protein WCQ90_05055 [Deltaproteobacteria bacterium]